jgi:hypothetical protein
MDKLSLIIKDLDLQKRGKYIKKEFQAYGLMLAKELNDWKNRSLYIKLAKQLPREILEQARYFIKDQPPGKIKNKAKLFMWKLAQLRRETKEKKLNDKKSPKPPPKRSKND